MPVLLSLRSSVLFATIGFVFKVPVCSGLGVDNAGVGVSEATLFPSLSTPLAWVHALQAAAREESHEVSEPTSTSEPKPRSSNAGSTGLTPPQSVFDPKSISHFVMDQCVSRRVVRVLRPVHLTVGTDPSPYRLHSNAALVTILLCCRRI